MEEEHSKLWRLALLVSLVAFFAAAYFKIPPFRSYVDEKFPIVREQLAQHGIKLVDDPSQASVEETSPDAPPTSKPAPKPSVNLDQVASNRSIWPKDVRLKTQVVFPAVVDGREVGKITVSAGTAVQLYNIQNQKLAVVYRGGGAWVPAEETDLLERVAGRVH